MSNGHTHDLSKYTFMDRPMWKYVMEMLGLEVGPQNSLIAIRRLGPWVAEDKVMVAARACKQHHAYFVLKFYYDEADRTVYCLAHIDNDSNIYCAYTFSIGDDNVCFYKVNSIVLMKNFVRAFLDVEIWIKVCFF